MSTKEERFTKYAAINYALSQMREGNPKFDEEAKKYCFLTDCSKPIEARFGAEFAYRAAAIAKDKYVVARRYTGNSISSGVYNFPYKKTAYEDKWMYKDFISLKDFCTFVGAWMKLVLEEKDNQLANQTADTFARLAFNLDAYFKYTMSIGNFSKFLEMLGMPTEYLLNATNDSPYGQLCIARVINLLNIATAKIITAIEGISDDECMGMLKKVTELYCIIKNSQEKNAKVTLDPNYPEEKYFVSEVEERFDRKRKALENKATKKEMVVTWGVGIASGLGIGAVATIILSFLPGLGPLLGVGAGIWGGYTIGQKAGRNAYNKVYNSEINQIAAEEEQEMQKTAKAYKEKVFKNCDYLLNEDNLQEIKDKIPQMVYLLQMQMETANEIIANDLTAIPAKYVRDKTAIETFIEYFDDGRVDSIKEAVNLYVSERRQEEYQEALMEQEKQRVLAEQQTARMAQKMALAEEEKAKLLGQIAEEQKESNRKMEELRQKQVDMEEERNESLGKIQGTLSDIKSKLD